MVNYLSRMNVSLGCDHAGPALKARVAAFLEARGVVAVNRGTDTEDRVDYPDYAHRVAEDVASGSAELGILICGSANGVAMAANKHAGIRAAIAWNAEVARLARGHNDANVLCLPARFISEEEALACVEAFLTTPFEGGRHAGRVAKIALTCALWVLSLAGLHAQTQLEAQRVRGWAATVAPAELEEQLTVFASDAFEGRETGTPGAEKASEFVRDAFAAAGLQPGVSGGWFQDVPMRTEKLVSGSFRISGTAYRFPEDVVFPPSVELEECPETDLFFAGYGIVEGKRDDYKGEALRGRVAVVFGGMPDGKSEDRLMDKRKWAEAAGAKALVVIPENYSALRGRFKAWADRPSTRLERDWPVDAEPGSALPVFYVSERVAEAWLGDVAAERKACKRRSTARALSGTWSHRIAREVTSFTGRNVVGILPGCEPPLSKESVVLTAHYDHIGRVDGQINNGADDDGSGTVTLIELAEACATAAREGFAPRRTMLFMAVVGEEKGLLGSEWYSEHPVWPLDFTVANLNIDMIGRTDAAHPDNERYVYLIGSDRLSTELHAVSETVNARFTQLALDYTFNAEDDPNRFYYRSDHYNFARKGVPVIFYFSGVHEDYHKPGDDAHKIRYGKMAEIGQLVFHTAWQLANQDRRIKVDRPEGAR
jgi:RpiB/LacA/LacB family sugar-phosphate isomerase